MAIENVKQSLDQGSTRERPGKTAPSSPPPKEEKKDTSIFGGKPDMKAGAFAYRLKKDQSLYSKTNLGGTRREELGKKIFGSYGSRIDKGEIEKAKKELTRGKWGKFKDFTSSEKQDAGKLLRGLSDK